MKTNKQTNKQTKKQLRGPCLESPGNFSGPELYFKIQIYGMVVKILARKPARLVCQPIILLPSFKNQQNLNL